MSYLLIGYIIQSCFQFFYLQNESKAALVIDDVIVNIIFIKITTDYFNTRTDAKLTDIY